MVEPTETEAKATLDRFVDVMLRIAKEAGENPEILLEAPRTTPVRRIDEVLAARQPNLRWKDNRQKTKDKRPGTEQGAPAHDASYSG